MEENLHTAEEFASSESFIAYYLKSDEAAIAYWEKWISLHPEKIDEVLSAERLLDMLHLQLPQEERDFERARLSSFITKNNTAPPEQSADTVIHKKPWQFGAMQIAAAIFLICSATLLFYSPRGWYKDQPAGQQWTSFRSPVAQRTTIRLSDGTAVTLNSGSTLTYPKSFNKPNRLVKLSGQAFFEVKHDQAHPFIVNTGQVNTRVLGTSFTVASYNEEPLVSVALLRGSVKVTSTSVQPDSLLLVPGEKMVYNTMAGKMHKEPFNAVAETGWKDGITAFKEADFNTIAGTFYRNFGLKLTTAARIKKLRYTGSYNNQNPESIIRSICFSLNMQYKINGKTIVLSPINNPSAND
jgi:transmembrane sensor